MNFQKIIQSSIFTIGLITCIAYAANTITSITQTAVNGDVVSATWVNEVNGKLKQDCGAGSVLQGFDANGNKICATLPSGGVVAYGGSYLLRYGYSPGCVATNVITGACSCPTGYTAHWIAQGAYYHGAPWDSYYVGYSCEK